MATKQQLTEEFLTCIVCHEVFTDPVTLHCGHTLCAECINGYLKTQAQAIANGVVPCPNCRGSTKVPDAEKPVEEWVGQIKTGFCLVETLATIPDVEKQLCSVCLDEEKRETASLYCMDCKKHYCCECEIWHRKMMKNHKTQRSTKAGAGKVQQNTIFCTEHAECLVDMMCEDCDKVLCHKCCIVYHRRCESVITLEQAVTKIDDVLEKQLLTLEQTVSNLKTGVSLTKTKVEMLEVSADKVEKELDATCERVMSLVVANQKQMKEKIASIKDFAVKDLQADVKNEELKLVNAQQKQGLIRQALKSEVPMDHYEMYRICSPGQVEYQSTDRSTERITQIDFSQKKIQNILKNLEESGLGNICVKATKKRKLKEGLDGEKKNMKKMMVIGRDGEKFAVRRRKSLEMKMLKNKQTKTSPTVSQQHTTPTSTPTHAVNRPGDINKHNDDSTEPDIISIIEKLLQDDSGGREEKAEDKKVETVPPLPPGLPDKLQQSIVQIKKAAEQNSEGKLKFFSGDVNKVLLDIEMQSHQISSGNRQAIYTHLSFFLPCTKETLVKRARKLRQSRHEDLLKDPINKLREAVNVMMQTLVEKYKAENQRLEKKEDCTGSVEKDQMDADGADSRKKFVWTDPVRNLLCDVVRVKMRSFVAAKQRGQTAEEFISCFLDMEIRPIWPPGWIQTKILYKESRAAHEVWTNPEALKEGTELNQGFRLEDDMEVSDVDKVITELPKSDAPTAQDYVDQGNRCGTENPPAKTLTASSTNSKPSSVPIEKSHGEIKHGFVTETLHIPQTSSFNSSKQPPSNVHAPGTNIPQKAVHMEEIGKLMATYASSMVSPSKPQSSTGMKAALPNLQLMLVQVQQPGSIQQAPLPAPRPSLSAQQDIQMKVATASQGHTLYLVDSSPSQILQGSMSLATPTCSKPFESPFNNQQHKLTQIGSVPQKHSLQGPLNMSPQGLTQTSLQKAGGSQSALTGSKVSPCKPTSKVQHTIDKPTSNDPRSLLDIQSQSDFSEYAKKKRQNMLAMKQHQLQQHQQLQQLQQNQKQENLKVSENSLIMPRTKWQIQYPSNCFTPGMSVFRGTPGNTKASKPLPHTKIPAGKRTVRQEVASAVTHSTTLPGTSHLTTTPKSGQGVMTPGTTSHPQPSNYSLSSPHHTESTLGGEGVTLRGTF